MSNPVAVARHVSKNNLMNNQQQMTPPHATRREWIGLAVIALPCLVYAMDMTVLNLAVPALSAELQPTSSQLLWIIDIYGFFVAGFLITMGTLGDRIGRRKLLLIGAAAFGAASVMAALAQSAHMLIAMRALLGIAGATLAPSTLSLIRNMFHHERERQLAIGVWIASFSLGGAMGPLVGGVMLQFFGWGSVFLLATPVMVLLLLLGPRLLPEYRDPNAGPLDALSVAQSLAAVLAVVYGIKRIAEQGVSTTSAWIIVAGVVMGVFFVRRQSRLTYPLLDIQLFRQPRFAAAIAAYGLSSLAMLGPYIFITQYLQLVLGLSPLRAGLATLPWALGFIVGCLWAPRWARRWSASHVLVFGLAASACGFGLMLGLDNSTRGLVMLMVGTLVISLGMAPVFTIGNEIIITAAPPERAGAASAISETAAEFSGALGIALFGSVGMAIYRHTLADTWPQGLSAQASADSLATLAGALAASASLPSVAGEALRASARAAFVDATQWAAAFSLVIALFACALTARILRVKTNDAGLASDRSSY
jgi:MFS transporter, DHA2 family, multidrug resistance protein